MARQEIQARCAREAARSAVAIDAEYTITSPMAEQQQPPTASGKSSGRIPRSARCARWNVEMSGSWLMPAPPRRGRTASPRCFVVRGTCRSSRTPATAAPRRPVRRRRGIAPRLRPANRSVQRHGIADGLTDQRRRGRSAARCAAVDATGSRRRLKSCPLPSPPAISTTCRRCPRPGLRCAASAAPTLVALDRRTSSTPRRSRPAAAVRQALEGSQAREHGVERQADGMAQGQCRQRVGRRCAAPRIVSSRTGIRFWNSRPGTSRRLLRECRRPSPSGCVEAEGPARLARRPSADGSGIVAVDTNCFAPRKMRGLARP